VQGSGTFRVIRDSDIEVEEEAEDLVRFFETALKRRRRGKVIRIETDSEMPASLRQFVVQALNIPDNRVAVLPGLLALNTLSEITKAPREDLRFAPTMRDFPSASANMPATASPPSAKRTWSSITPTNLSTSWSSFFSRLRAILTSWR